jgi:hypothetical protein
MKVCRVFKEDDESSKRKLFNHEWIKWKLQGNALQKRGDKNIYIKVIRPA